MSINTMKAFSFPRFWQLSSVVVAICFTTWAGAQSPAKLDPPVKPTVSGKFTGNGKNAAVKYVVVEEREPFSGRDAISLIFTEKDPVTVKKPSFDAMFGKL